MRCVGIRELKNRLSKYVRLVKTGEEVVVTDRGEIVAELRPPGISSPDHLHRGIDKLVKQGMARVGAPNDSSLYPRSQKMLSRGSSEALLNEERGQR